MASLAIMGALLNSVGQFLTDRCTIEQAVTAADAYGGSAQTWTIVRADVPCRVITEGTRAGATAPTGDRDSLRQSYRLVVGPDVQLGIDQRVTHEGIVYDVVAVQANLTDEVFRSAVIVRRA